MNIFFIIEKMLLFIIFKYMYIFKYIYIFKYMYIFMYIIQYENELRNEEFNILYS